MSYLMATRAENQETAEAVVNEHRNELIGRVVVAVADDEWYVLDNPVEAQLLIEELPDKKKTVAASLLVHPDEVAFIF